MLHEDLPFPIFADHALEQAGEPNTSFSHTRLTGTRRAGKLAPVSPKTYREACAERRLAGNTMLDGIHKDVPKPQPIMARGGLSGGKDQGAPDSFA